MTAVVPEILFSAKIRYAWVVIFRIVQFDKDHGIFSKVDNFSFQLKQYFGFP